MSVHPLGYVFFLYSPHNIIEGSQFQLMMLDYKTCNSVSSKCSLFHFHINCVFSITKRLSKPQTALSKWYLKLMSMLVVTQYNVGDKFVYPSITMCIVMHFIIRGSTKSYSLLKKNQNPKLLIDCFVLFHFLCPILYA